MNPARVIFYWIDKACRREVEQQLIAGGFEYLTELKWIKLAKTGELMNRPDSYARNTKEICLIATKSLPENQRSNIAKQIPRCVLEELRLEGQKPEAIYEIMEDLYPIDPDQPRHLELYGRSINLRRGWVTIGLNVTPSGYIDSNSWTNIMGI